MHTDEVYVRQEVERLMPELPQPKKEDVVELILRLVQEVSLAV